MSDGAVFVPPSPVPILGQAARLVAWFPTAVVVCNCQPHNDPVIVIGTAPMACPKCAKQFFINLIHHEREHPERHQFVLAVAVVAAGPAS